MGDNGRATPDTVPSSPPFSQTNYLPDDNLPSSPVRTSQRKERRLPSVTPRRLGRFFTPRSSLPSVQSLPGRQILGSLDEAAVNRQWHYSDADVLSSDPIVSSPTDRQFGNGPSTRKRRGDHRPDTVIKRRGILPDDSPLPRLNLGNLESASGSGQDAAITDAEEQLADKRRATLTHFFKASRGNAGRSKSDLAFGAADFLPSDSTQPDLLEEYQPCPIRKFRNRGYGAQLLDREHGFSSLSGCHHLARPVADPRGPCASFHSDASDLHHCNNYDSMGSTVVFSQASANSAPVTAIGDEQGHIRFFNTSSTAVEKVDIHFKVHENAVMDLAFSDDDLRLATACGDKTGKVVDVATQSVSVEFEGGHEDSMRQITFQPGQASGNVLATSDKAGRIRIWDLRCPSVPTGSFSHRGPKGTVVHRTASGVGIAQSTNCIRLAHTRTVHGVTSAASIPALQWFPGGRSHLLLSASEANAAIKLWDTRYIKPRRHAEDVALATTAQPRTHAWRAYGITSLALSSDTARLYAVCRDSIVYAYSTAHLMLGTAPDLAMPTGGPKHRPTGQDGLGPIYGLRHDALRVNSFYVKCALRQTDDPTREILAVGSSESSPILFPTDERYMLSSFAQNSHIPSSSTNTTSGPRTPHSRAASSVSQSPSPLLPIYSSGGTALIRGHSREVTTLSWSTEGRLVTASDDYIVRHWQEDEERARHLRQVGEFGGERYMCGWADVGEDWDLEDDEG